ncbi:MAG: kinase/pyrophosphorylase, partial [Burkholderiaceae bacterium]
MPNRSVFFLSDSTGITAETFGHAILAQFAVTPRQVRLPFVNSADKARQAVAQINQAARAEGKPPIVFSTVVNEEVLAIIQADCQGLLMDLFG